MKAFIRLIKALTVGTCSHGLYPEPGRRPDTTDRRGHAQPLPTAIALPMSRSGIYGSYSLYPENRRRKIEAGHAESPTAEVFQR